MTVLELMFLIDKRRDQGITKKNGWVFDWRSELRAPEKEVYKLTISGRTNIQGPVSITFRDDHIYMHLIESELVSFSQVTITDNFWKPRIEQVATTTLEACIYQTEVKTARIRNFEIVGGTRQGKFEGTSLKNGRCTGPSR